MLSPRRLRHLSASAAILMMAGLTACSTGPEPDPTPEPTTTDEVAVAPEDCILGTWLFDNSHLMPMVAAESGVALDSFTGRITFTADENGIAHVDYVDATQTAQMEDGSVVLVRNGRDSASYFLDDDGSFYTIDVIVDSQITGTAKADGMTIPLDPSMVKDVHSLMSQTTFRCVEETLTMESRGSTATLARVS